MKRGFAVSLVLVALALGACSKAADKTGSNTTPTTSSDSTSGALASGADTCLLSESDMATLTGKAVKEKKQVSSSCSYTLGSATDFGGTVLISNTPSGGAQAEACFKNRGCPVPNGALKAMEQFFKDAEPVPGLDHAYFITSVNELLSFHGDQLWIVLASVTGADTAKNKEIAVTITKKIAA